MKHNITTYIFLTTIVLCGVIFWETGFVEIVIGGIALIYLAITIYGSLHINANYFIQSVNKGKKKSIALTFDDGPDPDTTPKILNILREKNVKATFFVIGKKAEKYPDLLRQIDEEGHSIGNHSYSHNYLLGFFGKSRLTKDFARCNNFVSQTIGKTPLFFRPPFGVTNPRYVSALKMNSLESIGWSLRSLDTRAKTKYLLISNVISKLKKGDIVLLHDHLPVTADALDDLIEHIVSKRIEIEPLHQVINKEPYAKS